MLPSAFLAGVTVTFLPAATLVVAWAIPSFNCLTFTASVSSLPALTLVMLLPSTLTLPPEIVVPPSLNSIFWPSLFEIESIFFKSLASLTSKVPSPSALTLTLPAADLNASDAALPTPSPLIVTNVFNLWLLTTSLLPVNFKPSLSVATSSLSPFVFS